MPNDGQIYPALSSLSSENSENKFFALDLNQNLKVNQSTKNKRKFVCVELLNDKLQAASYSNKEVAIILETVKNKVKVIELAFYVKSNEKDKLVKEIKEKLKKLAGLSNQDKINKIKEHFKEVWVNFTPFASYPDLLEAYDQHTGEPITRATQDLREAYKEIENIFKEMKGKYGEYPEKFQKILKEMGTILTGMREVYEKNRIDFQHLSTTTVSSVVESFEELRKNFDKKCEQLKIESDSKSLEDRLNRLTNEITMLQADVISPKALCTLEIYQKIDKVEKKVNFLLKSVEESKKDTISDMVIHGLEEKFESLQQEWDVLKDEIKNLQVVSLPANTNETTLDPEKVDTFLKGIEPIVEGIKTHIRYTSGEKATILQTILSYLDDIKEKIKADISLAVIKDVVQEIKDFINKNINNLSKSTGFFSSKGKSADLIKNLGPALDSFIADSSTSQSRPKV